MRVLLLLLPAAFLGCADDESSQDPQEQLVKEVTKTKSEPVAPDTGITEIQKMHDMWARIVAAEEQKKQEHADVDQRTVEQALSACDVMIKTLQKSIQLDAEASARSKHATMRKKLARLRVEDDVLLREAEEIETILRDAANNVAPIPAGFTRAELADSLADVKEARRKHGGRLKTHQETMAVLEQALRSGKTPEQGETLATRELAAVSALRQRAEALR